MFSGGRNLARAQNDALLEKVRSPQLPASDPLAGHDVAVYVDGKRITLSYLDVTIVSNGLISIMAETTRDAALNPAVQATLSLAWGGYEPLQAVQYRVAPDEPSGGVFQITSVRPPMDPDGPAYFVGMALTDLFDWSDDGRKIAVAGDQCEILTTHVAPQH